MKTDKTRELIEAAEQSLIASTKYAEKAANSKYTVVGQTYFATMATAHAAQATALTNLALLAAAGEP